MFKGRILCCVINTNNTKFLNYVLETVVVLNKKFKDDSLYLVVLEDNENFYIRTMSQKHGTINVLHSVIYSPNLLIKSLKWIKQI